MDAPRARARSSRSRTIIHAPSPRTKPSRPASKGRDASRRRAVVTGRDGAHLREPKNHARRHAGIGAPRQNDFGFPAADERGRIGDGIGRARAARRHDVADAVQFERDRDLAREHADDGDGNRVGRDALPAIGEKLVVLPLGDVDSAGAAADKDAGVGLGDTKAGIPPRLGCRDDADERRARIAPRIGPSTALCAQRAGCDRHRILDGDRRHRRGDCAAVRRGVELGDGARGAAAVLDVVPEPLAPDAEGRHNADAGDRDRRSGHVHHSRKRLTNDGRVPRQADGTPTGSYPVAHLPAIGKPTRVVIQLNGEARTT